MFAFAIVGFGAMPIVWLPVEAREAHRPLQHHATVVNDGVVGSAFALTDGIAITNAHVVRGLAPGAPVNLVASGGGDRAVARLLATSARMDLAVLAIPRDFLVSVASQDAPRAAGLPIVAAGVDASGRRRSLPRMELSGTILVPSRHVPAFGSGLVAQVPGVRPGFSGGPILDRHGRLVGMLTAIRPGRARLSGRPVAASGFAPSAPAPSTADEAFVLGAREIRAEVATLLAGRD